MGGYSGSREQNYEIKYLRKTLGQVDSRIRVPESVSGDALRHLLDDVEPTVREAAKPSRPRWLSLQSGIAYAAAFVLIVALFYSSRIYNPDIIHGGMLVADQQSAAEDGTASGVIPFDTVAESESAGEIAAFALPEEDGQDSGAQSADIQPFDAPNTAEPPPDSRYAVGGSGMATLLLKHDEISYYWRLNDETDPDKAGFPCTLEIVNNADNRIAAQIDYDNIKSIADSFLLDDRLVVIGNAADSANLFIYMYDASDPLNPVLMSQHLQPGTFVDTNEYKGLIRVATISDEPFGDDIEELPNSGGAQQYCVLSVIDPAEYKAYTKSYLGENVTVQIYNLNAYIYYVSTGDSGAKKDSIAQIDFDDLSAGLATVR